MSNFYFAQKYFAMIAISIYLSIPCYIWELPQLQLPLSEAITGNVCTFSPFPCHDIYTLLIIYRLISGNVNGHFFFYLLLDYRTCQETDHKCGGGLCVADEKKCDGYFDCRDKSDESEKIGCKGTSCDLQEFRCKNGEKCIAQYQKCNHRKECTDGSDEEDCSKYHPS